MNTFGHGRLLAPGSIAGSVESVGAGPPWGRRDRRSDTEMVPCLLPSFPAEVLGEAEPVHVAPLS